MENGGPASLFDAYDLIRDVVGPRKLSIKTTCPN